MGLPPVGGFWANQRSATPDKVIDNSPALVDPEAIPYHYLPGSDVGPESPLIEASTEQLFPTYDGIIRKLPNLPPPANGTSYTANEFLGLHTAHQLEVLKGTSSHVTRSTLTLSDGTTRNAITIGSGADSITVVEATRDNQLYVVEHLQKRDFSIMSKLDQEAIAATSAFDTKIAAKFGLSDDRNLVLNGDGATGSPTQLGINDIIDTIKGLFPDSMSQSGLMSKADRDVFLNQVNAIKSRVENQMAVFSTSDILKQCNDILNRFKRAEAFATVDAQGGSYPQYNNICSLDDLATINGGYRKFIEQEKRLLSLENARLEIANTGLTENKKLDAPNLVFLFQLYYNLTTEAKVSAETEEVNQQNALLKTYSEFQRLLNVTLQGFDSSNAKDDKGFLGRDGGGLTFMSTLEAKAAAMFEDALAGGGNLARHPLEELRGITRVTADMFHNGDGTLNEKLKPWWDSFATQLSDSVTLINQESQIKMNDINSMDKQKNRHFDLANSALQKMNEVIQNIARSGAG